MSVNLGCITACIKRRRRGSTGVSLVEYMFVIGLGSIVAVAVIGFCVYTTRTFAGVYNYVELESQSRSALDQMTKEVRMTGPLYSYSSNHVSFQESGGNLLTFRYSPTEKTLVQERSGETKVLLNQCDSLVFKIFQRNTTNGTYDQYPTTLEASNTKLIQLSWVCSRQITGTRINTESVQTAKIVLRNQ